MAIHATTPRAITDRILSFCRKISPGHDPGFLSIEPEDGAALNDCFPTVERRVERQGGSKVMGWQVWEWPEVLLEADLHAVWRDSAGKLHDITPKPDWVPRILFLPDPARTYGGKQIDNIREALSDTPGVRNFIAAAEARFEFLNRGERASQHGEIRLTGSDQREWTLIQARMASATAEILGGPARPSRNDPCPCGSGRKFKKCHGG